jgi:uncharacterized surface protein with fasciclin (FAS1) repeats
MDYKSIKKAIEKGKGMAQFKTVSGGTLTAMMNGDVNIVLKDEKGNTSTISTYDVYQSNGVIHVINSVVMPN